MSSTGADDVTRPALTETHENSAEEVEQEQPERDTAVEKSQANSGSRPDESESKDESEGSQTAGPSAEQEKDGEAGDDENPPLPDEPVPTQNEWQAIWSPAHNAYYFYNSRTAETTWVNPLEPPAASSSNSDPAAAPTPSTSSAQPQPEVAAAAPTEPEEKPPQDLSYLNGIDPELAYLDPSLAVPPTGAKGPVPTFTARFGARSGKFTAMDGRQPEHLSEAARAQRMSSVYFDTAAWEREIAERDAKAKADREAGVGDKRKRVTKEDIERFKAQKQAKKALRNAWLRE
ncbi:hypothetical protein RhiJN_26814 [Ceratobasidium sp. AG-Ba]|nr:hypothetical protein RhiJN_26814 [Ceratobasidium sp. AG-Ba]